MMAPLVGQIAEEDYLAQSMQEVTFGVDDVALEPVPGKCTAP